MFSLDYISGDTIQQLCNNQLKPYAYYALNLCYHVKNYVEEKKIYKTFEKALFVHRENPRVYFRERDTFYYGVGSHCFMIYTLPYNERKLPSDLFTADLEKYLENISFNSMSKTNSLFNSWPMSTNPADLFPRANELFLYGYRGMNRLSMLNDC